MQSRPSADRLASAALLVVPLLLLLLLLQDLAGLPA
jgi:hypothetical protein